jgi:hypothetical protein
MAGSDFSIVNGADGVTKVPIATPAKDANGNTVVGHTAMTVVSGVAIPIGPAAPMLTAPSASNIVTNQVSVGTSATQIVAARANRRSVLIVQEGTTLVRVGGSSVTTSTGIPLPGVQYSELSLDGGAAIYGIVASGTAIVSYAECY